MFNYFQRLGKSLMLPIASLPICAILMGIGYFLAPASMGAGGDITSIQYHIGLFLTTAGKALIDNIAILFVIGVGMGMSKKGAGTGAMAALAAWLVFITILNADNVAKYLALDDVTQVAFSKIANPFIGILAGLIGSGCYNKFSDVQLPEFLAFFSGRRFVPIMAVIIATAVSFLLLYVWPVLFGGLVAFGELIVHLKGGGVGVYAAANRLLIPTGLHHALNNVFWFDTIGIGDLTKFWAGLTSDDVDWSLGMYMSGFFPCMMFGIPGACLAMIRRSKNKKATLGILGSIAFCAFFCGVTEPFEFLFIFVAFPLFVIYSILFGIFSVITYYVGFRAGFSFSGGLLDLIFSSSLPAAANTWMIIPLGIAAFIVFYAVFSLYMKFFKVPIPGSGDIKEAVKNAVDGLKDGAKELATNDDKGDEFVTMAKALLEAIGGIDNLEETDHCVTRLRLTVKDASKVDDNAIVKAGASGVIKPTKNACQIVIGTKVQFVYDAFCEITGDEG